MHKVQGIARYPHIVKPSAVKDTDVFKYSINVLIHKKDAQIAKIQQWIAETTLNTYPKGEPKDFKSCFTDLAITSPENLALKDYMCLNTQSKAEFEAPQVVGTDLLPVLNSNLDLELTGRVVVVAFGFGCWKYAGKAGISAYLNAVMVSDIKGDIPLEYISSKPSIESIFDEEIEDYVAPVKSVVSKVMSPPPPVPKTVYRMTEAAQGNTREELIAAGWTDAQLISEGMMLPPVGLTPSWES